MPLGKSAPHELLIELGAGRRLTLRLGRHDRYLGTEEPDGTIILRPAVVMTEDERALLAVPWLAQQIEDSMRNPASRTRRGRPQRKE